MARGAAAQLVLLFGLLTIAGAAAEHSRRQLQDYSVVADHITALVQKVCALQSGRNCDAVVLDGVAPYWEASFWANSMLPSSKMPPISVTAGLTPPIIPLDGQSVYQALNATNYCPYKNDSYTCYLAKSVFQQKVDTTTSSSGWNLGTSVKVSGVYGVALQKGPVASFSFAYSWQNAHAEGTTQQTTTTNSVAVEMDRTSKKCAVLRTYQRRTKAHGAQYAYVAVNGHVGTWQGAHSWWRLLEGEFEATSGRVIPFVKFVQVGKLYRLPEADMWEVVDGEARAQIRINIDIDFVTEGQSQVDWFDAGSDACKRMGSHPVPPDVAASEVAAAEATRGDWPVVPAIPASNDFFD